MSIVHFAAEPMTAPHVAPHSTPISPSRHHRVSTVRRTQGISIRRAAALLGITVQQARSEEDETRDLPISRLMAWQKILDVPLSDLVGDPATTLAEPILQRARMLRIMKTVMAISERARDIRVRRLVTMLSEQLREAMPELAEVRAWPEVGKRRTSLDVGQAAHRAFDGRLFGDSSK